MEETGGGEMRMVVQDRATGCIHLSRCSTTPCRGRAGSRTRATCTRQAAKHPAMLELTRVTGGSDPQCRQ
eukprot:756755-Hanusia_phi.AAC.3